MTDMTAPLPTTGWLMHMHTHMKHMHRRTIPDETTELSMIRLSLVCDDPNESQLTTYAALFFWLLIVD